MPPLRWLAAAAVTIGAAAWAQGPVFSPAMKEAQVAVEAGRYLAAYDLLTRETFPPAGSPSNPLTFQLWGQYTPYIINELDPAVYLKLRGGTVDPAAAARVAGAQPRDAIATIVERARSTRVVILNEAHYSPRDRAFALEVARALRPLGYTVLAAETFRNYPVPTDKEPPMERLRRDGFVRRGTGGYTLDPVFAGYVREALKLGYRPVAYEQTDAQGKRGDIAAREQAQAENLLAVLKADPTAKILIHVGHSHVAERFPADATPWMAARLKTLSGIDPLTIDQTILTDLSSTMRAAYAAASARSGPRPAVLFKKGRPLVLGRTEDWVDLQVIHPARRYRHGRPAWLATLGGRPTPVPARLLPAAGRRLVQAFAANAPDDAVPLDQVLVEAGKPAATLLLPPGPVRYAVQE